MNLDQLFKLDVKGFLSPNEAKRLYDLALEASRKGPCLEIGGYCGKSTLFLGAACKENNAVLFSIDHHQGSEEQQPGQEYFDPELFDAAQNRINTFPFFLETIQKADLLFTVAPLVCESGVAARQWKTPLSLVFIDGGHAYETVLSDYTLWHPHVMPGGYLLFHDIFKDPQKGGQAPHEVYRLALESGVFEALSMTETLGVLKKQG